jgi:hypothetical protein
MKNIILVVCLILLVSSACQKHDSNTEKEKIYTTLKGNTYVAESPASWELGMFIIYKMDNDSTIDIEERMYSVDGDLKDKSKGYFKYTHPTLKLRVQSISGCDNCFNYFTATVDDDRKSFRYSIFDLGDLKNKIIEFKIKP